MDKQSGFSLMEVMIAVGVISLVSVIIAQSFFTTTRTNIKVEVTKEAKQSGTLAINVIERMLRNATGVLSACNTGPATSIQIQNRDGGTTTFQCIFSGDVSRIASISAVGTQYLTPGNMTVGGTSCADPDMSLRFDCTTYTYQPTHVQALFKVSQKGTPVDSFEQASSVFQTSVNLRTWDY